MKKGLKLFIWTNFCPDWTDGLAFALAKDEAEARKLVEGEYGDDIEPVDWGDLEVKSSSRRIARAIGGGS